MTMATSLRDPLPEMQTFNSWRLSQPGFHDYSITNDVDRMLYMEQVLWPFWTKKTQEGREELINKTVDQAIKEAEGR